ncbi:MAG: 5,6-dimethylbenzimidazole synthase [Nitrososphaeraceae archaeon]
MDDSYLFSQAEKDGLYKAIFSRRDVRSHFIKKKIPYNIISKILNAAHHAPSVGYSQPWNFILIKDEEIRNQIKNAFISAREGSISTLNSDTDRQEKYQKLKLEGIIESDINICITYDVTRFGPFVIGRTSIPETGEYSVCCAVQNLWLAARAEGIGVGWVSIITVDDLRKILSIPCHIKPIAYLCIGYVSTFSDVPDLEKSGWLKRMNLSSVIYYEQWGKAESESWSGLKELINSVNT